ncbi:hypothetical protein OUZ56_005304 [Daphnia magna]|uniref:Uncharacterized protein n=1 Tax=Daphnia magna TaxID=35525 RepID=A0ABQ9YSF2_9CRUS|nr:hypothetical protein OUZ56_005304 [Daphnia magna]
MEAGGYVHSTQPRKKKPFHSDGVVRKVRAGADSGRVSYLSSFFAFASSSTRSKTSLHCLAGGRL